MAPNELLFTALKEQIMATQDYVEVPGCDGSSADADHPKWMDAAHWSIHAYNPGGFKHGGAGAIGKTAIGDLQFTTYKDAAFPLMVLACCNHKHFPKVVLECFKEAGDTRVKYQTIELEDCVVSSANGGTGGDRPMASYSFNFAKITLKYTPQGRSGAGAGEITHYWDQQINAGG